MKNTILGLILITSVGLAAEKPKPNVVHRLDSNTLSVAELKQRLYVIGEMFVLDASGKRLLQRGAEWRKWNNRDQTGKIESNWSSQMDEGVTVALHHRWEVQEDGSLKALIEQFAEIVDKKDGGPEFKKLVKKEEFVVENFQPVTWVAVQDEKSRIIVRFSPSLSEEPETTQIGEIPISGSELVISDNLGNVWASEVDLQAKFAGFITHRGGLFLSYYPFAGAKELGYAAGNLMELSPDKKLIVKLKSQSLFLPAGTRAKVYGIYDANKKTHRLTSVRTLGHGNEGKFLESMARK